MAKVKPSDKVVKDINTIIDGFEHDLSYLSEWCGSNGLDLKDNLAGRIRKYLNDGTVIKTTALKGYVP